MRLSTQICLSILGLVFVLDLCYSKPNLMYEGGNDLSTSSELEADEQHKQVPDIPLEFSRFELRMKSYIDVKREQLATMSNASRFLEEVDIYLAKLPMNGSKIVTTRTRDICHCEGKMMTPCPARCMYSCYLQNTQAFSRNDGWHYEDDCRGIAWNDCQCTKDSTSCYQDGELEICMNQRTEVLPENSSCSHYSIDKNELIGAFRIVKNILMEPLNKYFRKIDSQLAKLKRSSLNLRNLAKYVTNETSSEKVNDPNDPTIHVQIEQQLSEAKTHYNLMKKNLTLELIKTQSRIEDVSQKLEELEEQTLAKISHSTKEYACCLKILDFSLDGYDCTDMNVQPQPSTTTEIIVSTSNDKINTRCLENYCDE